MGNRILKESICMSREIDALTDFQECLFCRIFFNACVFLDGSANQSTGHARICIPSSFSTERL